MKVSVLTPDLSHNCLGRAHLLAKLLERNYEVEVVGPKLDGDVWAPVRDDYDYKSVDAGPRIYSFLGAVPDLVDLIDGDVVLASKPRAQSYGVALLNSLGDDVPVVLDVDDWETGFLRQRGRFVAYTWGIPTLVNVESFYYMRILEALSDVADARTVSNTFLESKFGGTLVPHVRDTDTFDPDRFDKRAARERFDLPTDEFLVMFSGTPRPHKGVEHLAQAVSAIDDYDVRLVLVGAHESDYVDRLRRVGGDSLIVRGQQPFEDIPEWLAAADVVSIPQERSSQTRGQLPAKVFDAMAMGKPIVATAVSDLPEVLDGCGYLVEPNSDARLREAIERLLGDEQLRETLGRRARAKCVAEYSHDAMAPRLADVIESVT